MTLTPGSFRNESDCQAALARSFADLRESVELVGPEAA